MISKYWDIDRTLTHNALFYVIVGNRSAGKSYGCKKRGISNFIKKGWLLLITYSAAKQFPIPGVYLANIHQCDRFLSRIYGNE